MTWYLVATFGGFSLGFVAGIVTMLWTILPAVPETEQGPMP
jgi:hypothetical protein